MKISNKLRIEQVIKKSIEMFNKLFSQSGIFYELNTNSNLYSIKPSKKSGQPDNDLPSIFILLKLELNENILVHLTNIKNFSLIYDRKDLIYITKNKSFFNKNCPRCFIF